MASWLAGNRLLDVDVSSRLEQIGDASKFRQAFEAVAAERSKLLAAVRSSMNHVLLEGLDAADGLDCAAPIVRDMCLAIESCLEHHLLPPIFSLSGPSLWHALSHLKHARRRDQGGLSNAAGDDMRHQPGEAVALAQNLCEQHLSLHAPYAPAVVRNRYAARLWLCLALRRRVAQEWVWEVSRALSHAYADGSLLTTREERDILIDLLAPLSHITFRLPERPPQQLAAFLALSESANDFLPPELGAASGEEEVAGEAGPCAVDDEEADTTTAEPADARPRMAAARTAATMRRTFPTRHRRSRSHNSRRYPWSALPRTRPMLLLLPPRRRPAQRRCDSQRS
jgi:hypothetical protein